MNFPRIVARAAPASAPAVSHLQQMAPSTRQPDAIPATVEQELRAMRICFSELDVLDTTAQDRVIAWVEQQLRRPLP